MVALAIAALANVPAALADTYSGPTVSLGAGNVNIAPTDVYSLICPAGTASVRARVSNPDRSRVDEITVEVINPNGPVRTATSLEGIAPPTAVLAGGAGRYLVTVHKDSSPFAVRYGIVLDCFNARAIAFAGTQSRLAQNQ